MNFKNDTNYLDQHFLINESTINYFIDVCNFNKDDIVVEIGPGKGTLTKLIAPKVKKLICIEKDVRLSSYLDNISNIEVIYASVLDIEIPRCNKIITSLPYSIIEPFMYKLRNVNFDELYMLIGENFVINAINNKIDNLSLLTNTYFNVELLKHVPKTDFDYQPKVESDIIKIEHKKDLTNIDIFIRFMYELDQKAIKNALIESLIKYKNITQKESKKEIKSLNISENILNTKFNLISNEELKIIYEKVFYLINK